MKTSESCNYNLLDLLSIGLGATIGSGVFVVTGQVAKDGVGPSIVGSWILAAIACCLSAASFAELSCRLPDSCSSYSFVRKAMGEFPAVIAASCMTLECGISAASVARSWAVKVNILIHEHFPSITFFGSNNIDSGLNLTATVLMLVVTLIFLSGVNSSKQTVNVLTAMKMTIIGMIIIVGFYIFDEGNLRPLAPGGVHGVLRGAATCFFGYVGYDEVCCVAMETKNPAKLIPQAIFGTIMISAAIYALSALALVGMQSYRELHSDASFYFAFLAHDLHSIATLTFYGEILTLPLVVLASYLPQPRILVALARDNLLPRLLLSDSERGRERDRAATSNSQEVSDNKHSLNISNNDNEEFSRSILFSGLFCAGIAAVTPYALLNDVISAGVLLSFNLTNLSLLLIRFEESLGATQRDHRVKTLHLLLLVFSLVSFLAGVDLRPDSASENRPAHENLREKHFLIGIFTWSARAIVYGLLLTIPVILQLYYFHELPSDGQRSEIYFQTPFVPYTPLLGTFVNNLLITQLSPTVLSALALYFLVVAFYYFLFTRYFAEPGRRDTSLWSLSSTQHHFYYYRPEDDRRSLDLLKLPADIPQQRRDAEISLQQSDQSISRSKEKFTSYGAI